MKRLLSTRRLFAVLAALILVVLASVSVVAGGAITGKEIGSFTVPGNEVGYAPGHVFTATLAPGSVVDTGLARLAAGASFGWHHHSTTIVVTVTAGTLTLYDTNCTRQTYSAGQGFVEEAGVTHLARNEGSQMTEIVFTYLGVPPGQPEDIFEPSSFDPCPGIR